MLNKSGMSTPNKSQHRSTFVGQRKLNDVEPCIISLKAHPHPICFATVCICFEMLNTNENASNFKTTYQSESSLLNSGITSTEKRENNLKLRMNGVKGERGPLKFEAVLNVLGPRTLAVKIIERHCYKKCIEPGE